MSDFDINKLISMLGNVSQEELQNSIKKANEIMNSKDKDEIINELQKKLK